jgi:hypothetical protein
MAIFIVVADDANLFDFLTILLFEVVLVLLKFLHDHFLVPLLQVLVQ